MMFFNLFQDEWKLIEQRDSDLAQCDVADLFQRINCINNPRIMILKMPFINLFVHRTNIELSFVQEETTGKTDLIIHLVDDPIFARKQRKRKFNHFQASFASKKIVYLPKQQHSSHEKRQEHQALLCSKDDQSEKKQKFLPAQ